MTESWVDEKGVRRAGPDPRQGLDQHAEQAMSAVLDAAEMDLFGCVLSDEAADSVGTGTLLAPESREQHRCVPPMLSREILPPLGPGPGRPYTAEMRAADAKRPRRGHVITETPERGSTWDCPDCARVWVVLAGARDSQGSWVSGGRTWVRAGWGARRRHRRRLAQEGVSR